MPLDNASRRTLAWTRAALLAAAPLLFCCAKPAPAAVTPPAPPSEAPLANSSGTDAGASAAAAPVEPRTLPLKALAVSGDASVGLNLRAPNDGVSPDARFDLELPAMTDVRVRLFDVAERQVASSDKLEAGAATRYVLQPTTSLTPGSRYTLVVDGQVGDLATDKLGQTYDIVRLELRTSGEKPAPVPAKAKAPPSKKKRSRRR